MSRKRMRCGLREGTWRWCSVAGGSTAFVAGTGQTFGWPLRISSPSREAAKHGVQEAGSSVSIIVDDGKFAGWKKLELCDGATKLGELAKGPAPIHCDETDARLPRVSVLGMNAEESMRTSNSVMVAVRANEEH